MKLIDQIQKLRAHILDPNCRVTLCGMSMVNGSLTRTIHGEYVFGDVSSVVRMELHPGWGVDCLMAITEEELVKPFICEECLARELPSIYDHGRPSPYRMIQAMHNKQDFRATQHTEK